LWRGRLDDFQVVAGPVMPFLVIHYHAVLETLHGSFGLGWFGSHSALLVTGSSASRIARALITILSIVVSFDRTSARSWISFTGGRPSRPSCWWIVHQACFQSEKRLRNWICSSRKRGSSLFISLNRRTLAARSRPSARTASETSGVIFAS